jgi:hypothetical protein
MAIHVHGASAMRIALTFFACTTVAVVGCGPRTSPGDVDGGAGLDAPPDAMEPTCMFQPTGQFNPGVECSWEGPSPTAKYPTLGDVVMTPVVVNLTDDDGDGQVTVADIPDIAFVSYQLSGTACPTGVTCGCCNSSGVLRIVSGGCQAGALREILAVGADEIFADIGVAGVWLDSSGGLAAGDIDSDGSVDLVATVKGGGTIAFERDGHVKWYQPVHPAGGTDHLAGTQPAIADLDADGHPEVLQGRVVLNGADGSLKWRGDAGVGTNGFMGPVSVAGDLDLDGKLELLAGGTAYRHDGTVAWTYTYPTAITVDNCQSTGFACDGFTATGNFDADPQGEVVSVRAGTAYILNHDGTPMEHDGAVVAIALPDDDCAKPNEGGPPTVADFDGDGEAEIGVAAADFYTVLDLECLATPLPAQCTGPGVRWQVANQDCSSRVTGSSVFDFDGDGRAEVVYADETAFRVFDGSTGNVRLSVPNRSHTRLEMPIVVDVDNDGNAEAVYIENANGGTTHGIRVLGDSTDSWVPTRRIWNQHSYHVTNVSELGAIPAGEPANWNAATPATPSGVMNNFRQNLPESNAFAAPDLTVTLALDANACTINATVCNAGDIVVGAGVPVHFYDNGTQQEIACDGGTPTTALPLAPGACAAVTCHWPAPQPNGAVDVKACVDNATYACTAGMAGGNNECKEDNNQASATATQGCAVIP